MATAGPVQTLSQTFIIYSNLEDVTPRDLDVKIGCVSDFHIEIM